MTVDHMIKGKDKLPPRRFVNPIKIHSEYSPAGDQPQAIEKLVQGLQNNSRNQVLLGVTGSGKTFTMAHVIEQLQKTSLILAPNKTLAAQLYGEMKEFFPENAVEYFVSYYDYYQPEAYVARSDTYIEKDASVNEQIDRMRHSATRSLLERKDVVIVASVSCIYGIGDVETYSAMTERVYLGEQRDLRALLTRLVELQYQRNDMAFGRGTFRVRGDTLELHPAHLDDRAWRISFFGDEVDSLNEFDPLTGEVTAGLNEIMIFANSHYVTTRPSLQMAIETIKQELKLRLDDFNKNGQLLEAQRLQERTQFDLEMMTATGMCGGIENYSRHLTGRPPGAPPPTLFEYLPDDALLFVDESHVTVPQLGGMYRGDFARKSTLSDYGFRLPSCLDNRPLKFEEWEHFRPSTVFVSATPGPWEMETTAGEVVEQVVRPTGLIDPVCTIRPTKNQVDDLMSQCRAVIDRGERVLITTLTKRMAEDLSEYMGEAGFKVRYMHSDIDTLERMEIIRQLRTGTIDVLIGINLLREGLDIPECSLVAIMDADKEGFLRSRTSLVQTIGRAARNINGRVLLYADRITDSLQYALDETERRRALQQVYNEEHNITPESVQKSIGDILQSVYEKDRLTVPAGNGEVSHFVGIALGDYLKGLRERMRDAAGNLEFELAAEYRDEISRLESNDLQMPIDCLPVNEELAERFFIAKRDKKRKAAARRQRSRGGRGGSARA